MKRIVAGLGVMACLSFSGVRGQNIDNPPIQGECLTWWCEVVRCPDGSMTFGELVIWPESPLCVGTTIYATPNMDATCGEPVGVFRWAPETTNCPPVYWTNACSYPHSVTNWWVVSHPGFSASGAGLGVQFTPTNWGSGTISFYNVWTNTNPCTGLDGCGGGTNSISRTFTVEPPMCDRPHTLLGTGLECLHSPIDTNGTPCSITQIIENVLNSATCDHHPERLCPGICDIRVGTGPAVIQTLYNAACPSQTVSFIDWFDIWFGCSDCQHDPNYPAEIACVTDTLIGSPAGFEELVGERYVIGCDP